LVKRITPKSISKINLKSFWDFCKGLGLASAIGKLSEPKRYFKSNKLIYRFVLVMSLLGKTALLQMDQTGRFEKWKRLFGIGHYSDDRLNHCVVSDSTLPVRLGMLKEREVLHINYQVFREGLRRGWIRRIAIVDGTQWSGQLYSCLCFLTRWGDVVLLDKEPIAKRGKELAASHRVVKRFCDKMGKGVIELLLADMLYFNERFWQLRQKGYIKDLLVKYTPNCKRKLKEPYRKVLQRFEELVAMAEKEELSKSEKKKLYHLGFRHKSGFDEERMVTYQIYSADSNSWDRRFKVARVVEKDVKTEAEQHFYVITTAKSLSAERMRELGHKRWYIENDGFKMLNAHLKSKQYWNDNPQVLANLILIWILAFSLLWLFRRIYDHQIRQIFHRAKLTARFVAQILEQEPCGKLSLDSS
jgi:hypothetical protein